VQRATRKLLHQQKELSLEIKEWVWVPDFSKNRPPGGTSILKGWGCLSYLSGVKGRFWYLLGCSASKGSQWEVSRYLLGYWAEKYRGEKHFKPRPQNSNLVPLRGFLGVPLLFIWEFPLPGKKTSFILGSITSRCFGNAAGPEWVAEIEPTFSSSLGTQKTTDVSIILQETLTKYESYKSTTPWSQRTV